MKPIRLLALPIVFFCVATHSAIAGEECAPANPSGESVSDTAAEAGFPAVVLDGKLLYELLAAEFSDHTGDHRRAFGRMLSVAEKTRDSRLARRAAEIAVRTKNVKMALEAVRLWHELDPASVEAERYLMGFLGLDNRFDELKSLMSAGLANTTPGKRPRKIYRYQQFLSSVKDKAKAFDTMEQVLAPYPDIPEARIALSSLALANQDQVRAQAEAKEALRLNPRSELAVLTLAQAEVEPQRAINTLTAFLAAHPDSREVRISLGRLLIVQKEYARARQEFEKVLAAQSDDPMILHSLLVLSIRQNDYPAAEAYVTQYLDVLKKGKKGEAESYQAIFMQVQFAEEQKRYRAALRWLDKITDEADSATWIMAQVKRAQILFAQGDIRKGRHIMASLQHTFPSEKEKLLLTEAQLLRNAGENLSAFALLRAPAENPSASAELLYDFSLCAEKIGKYEEMEAALRRILQMEPNNHHAYNALGYSLADRNIRLDEAYQLIDKALELVPDDPYVTDSMGWVLFRQGKLDDAETLLRRAYDAMPEIEVIAHLGEVLWLKGKHDEARKLFDEATKRDPGNDILIQTVKRLGVSPRESGR